MTTTQDSPQERSVPQAGLHRRRGRRQGLPGLDRPPVQLLHAAEAQADPLRGRHGRGPAGPAALPDPGLALRLRRRPRRLPAGLDRAQGLGLGPARPRARPGLRRQWSRTGRRTAGTSSATPTRSGRLTLYRYNSNVVRQVTQNVEAARQSKAFEQWNPNWVRFVEQHVGAWMHVDHGLGLYLFANANRRAPTNMHNNAISVNSMHRIRAAQDLALYNLTLSEEIEGFDGTAHLETWNSDPAWQGVREVAEQLTAIDDWCEAIFAANVVFEPLVGELFRSQLVQQAAPAQRRLRHPDGDRRGRVRLRRARPALHQGDVRAAHQRPRVRRPQQGRSSRTGCPPGSARRSPRPARCSRCGRSRTPSRRDSRTALDRVKSRFTRHRRPAWASTSRRSWHSDARSRPHREPVQVRQHRVQQVRRAR